MTDCSQLPCYFQSFVKTSWTFYSLFIRLGVLILCVSGCLVQLFYTHFSAGLAQYMFTTQIWPEYTVCFPPAFFSLFDSFSCAADSYCGTQYFPRSGCFLRHIRSQLNAKRGPIRWNIICATPFIGRSESKLWTNMYFVDEHWAATSTCIRLTLQWWQQNRIQRGSQYY